MKTSKASAALWSNANRRTSAERGLGDPANAMHEIVTIKQLMRQIGTNPDALGLLAARSHEMTPEQITVVLKAHGAAAPKARKPKAAKPAMPAPGARRGLAGVPLRGFHQ